MGVCVGLDFGTTNSSIAIARDDRPPEALLFRASHGSSNTYRSVLYFEPKNPAYSGPSAIERYLSADDKGRLIQSLKSFLADRLFTATDVFGRHYTIEDLIAIILRDLWREAEATLGLLSGPVVVGRPVRFSHAKTEADNEFALDRLTRSLEKAGIGPVVFEYEPVAAAYFYEGSLDHDELIMIGDFGGGTSDFSLLRVGPGIRSSENQEERILGTAGVAVAGDAFDGRIVRNLVSPAFGCDSQHRSLDKSLPMPAWIYSELERWHYLSFLKSNRNLQMLRSIQSRSDDPQKIAALLHLIESDLGFNLHQAVQTTKAALSSETVTQFLFEDYEVSVESAVQRGWFEHWIEEELQEIQASIDLLLSRSGIDSADVDRVFLTGGSSLVPIVHDIFVQRFGENKISRGSEFTSVAKGLAARALREPPQ